MRSSGGLRAAGWPARRVEACCAASPPGRRRSGLVVRGGRGARRPPALRARRGRRARRAARSCGARRSGRRRRAEGPPGRDRPVGAAGPHARRGYGRGTPCSPASRTGRARGPPGQRVAVWHPRRSGTPRGGAVPARGNAAGPAARWGAGGPGSGPGTAPCEEWLPRCRGPGPSTRLGWQVRSVPWSGRGALPAWARDPVAVHHPGRPCRVAHGDGQRGEMRTFNRNGLNIDSA